MTISAMLKRPSAFLPLILASGAVLTILRQALIVLALQVAAIAAALAPVALLHW